MAFSSNNNFVLLIAFLLIINAHLFTGTSAIPLDDICNLSKNKAFCVFDFGSDPLTKTATLPQLVQLAITKAQAKADSGISKIQFALTNGSTDPIYVLNDCDRSYIDATNALGLAVTDLTSQNYHDLSLHGGQASDAGIRCETSFNTQPNLVEGENTSLQYLGDIIDIAANMLNSGKLELRKLLY